MVELLVIVAPVFGLVALGYCAAWASLADEKMAQGLSAFVFTFAAPCLLFRLIVNSTFPATLPWGFWVAYFAGMAAVWAAAGVLSRRLFAASPGDAVIAGLSAGQANTVMIGIPIILKAYGEGAGLAIALLLAVNLPITMTIATVMLEGARNGSGGAPLSALARGLLTHPILIGIAGGVTALAFGVRPPGPMMTIIDMLAAVAVPGALFGLGLALRKYGFLASFPIASMVSGLRLIVHPAIAFVLAVHVFALPPVFAGAAVLFAATPAGVNAYLFAARYGQGEGLASSAVALSTLLSVVTTLFWLWALGVGM